MYNDMHINCGGDVAYNTYKDLPVCEKCHDEIYNNDEIAHKRSIMNGSDIDVAKNQGKGAPKMMSIEKYIDTCLLDEYATKDLESGCTLFVDDLPPHEINNFLDKLMQDDTAVRDFVRYQMQELIDQRLPRYESEHNYNLKDEAA